MQLIPTIGMSGRFEVRAPWSLDANSSYRCEAIRSLKDLYVLNVDPFERYFRPFEVPKSEFEKSVKVDALIVTLVSLKDGQVHYIPTDYITKLPDTATIDYRHFLMTIDLSLLPSNTDFTGITEGGIMLAKRALGVNAKVVTSIAPTEDIMPLSEHQRLTDIRKKMMEKARNQDAPYDDLDLVKSLVTRLKELEDWILAIGDVVVVPGEGDHTENTTGETGITNEMLELIRKELLSKLDPTLINVPNGVVGLDDRGYLDGRLLPDTVLHTTDEIDCGPMDDDE